MKPTSGVRGLALAGLVWSVSGAVGAEVADAMRVLQLPGYCEAGGGCDEHIARVQVGSIDNATDCAAPGGYGDYSSLSTDMTIGSGYAITVTNGHPIYSGDQCKVWVDWNQDLDFYDAGEAFAMTGSPGNGPYTGIITPPVAALEGSTRMRVRITYTGALDPCGITTYGEVEDYTINVLPAGAEGACCQPDGSCVVTYAPYCTAGGGTYAGDNTACAGDDCNLNGQDDVCDILSGVAEDCNENGVPDECDIASGVSEDCQWDGIPDECQLGGDEVNFQYDDGTHESAIGLNAGGAIVWMNHFVVSDGGLDIIAISVAWGDVPDGTLCAICLWSDPNQDGDPTDAQLIASTLTVVANADTDILSTVTIPTTNVGPAGTGFFAGAWIEHAAGQHPASVDRNGTLHGQSWIAGDTAYNLDPDNLGAAEIPPVNIDTIPGLEGNWLIRATGLTASHDCNANGRPDECDIFCGYSLDCNLNAIPDECDLAGGNSADCNGNGVPDECDLFYFTSQDCNGNTRPDECDIGIQWGGYCIGPDCETDLNYNGIPDSCDDCGDLDADVDVDMDDYWVILSAFGSCAGDPEYVAAADADGDHCITLYDFWYWRICYMFANGRDFDGPEPLRADTPARSSPGTPRSSSER